VVKRAFWKTDWFAGVAITVVFLLASGSTYLQGLERFAYDVGVRASDRAPSEQVAVIAIDDESIANIGRWPWSRDIHAELIRMLEAGGAKVIGHTVFFLEPQIDPGLAFIRDISNFFADSSIVKEAPGDLDLLGALIGDAVDGAPVAEGKPAPQPSESLLTIADFYAQSSLSGRLLDDLGTLGQRLLEAEAALNTDRILAEQIANAGSVVLSMPLVLGQPRGNPDSELPAYVTRNALLSVGDRIGAAEAGLFPLPTVAAIPPIPEVGEPAAAIGHLNSIPDVDGGIRTEPLVLLHYDTYLPSLALQVAARFLNLSPDDIQVHLGEGVQLKNLVIHTDPNLLMNTFFYGDRADGRPAFAVDSFFDVISGKIPVDKYRNKIVLIGATAVGVGSPQVTPVSPAMAPVLTLAHSVSSILNEDFFVRPEWAAMAEWGIFLVIAVYLIALLPKLKAGMGAAITLVLLLALLTTHMAMMISQAMWLQLVIPATLLVVGHLLLTTKRFLVTEKAKERTDTLSAESNRMLGLQFQGQGQLDMAFDAFRKVPLDKQVMDNLYNLALDFERKRQYNKASSVYQYMATFDPNFRDLKDRVNRTKAMEETVMFGGGGASAAGTLIMDGGGGMSKPMLGRYEVEKELGKGAMGVVYLGKDPKINRVVAIKTMALSQEFEADELEDVKARFFREAETAGRLTHPNIVTIFDAGEEHDLAYIAMEFLKGKDLVPFTKKDALLPVTTSMDLVAKAADALSYAHAQNVVHRDIKPANIMYEPVSGSMKITDFGIARITDSSRTKTGMVLGTPSYMSPEQLSGKKVDGRSDLFSLGVMLYQMVTGTLPFTGDSMATLMYKIANDPHPDITTVKADVPPCLKAVLDKALAKNADERYQTGTEFAQALRECAAQLG